MPKGILYGAKIQAQKFKAQVSVGYKLNNLRINFYCPIIFSVIFLGT